MSTKFFIVSLAIFLCIINTPTKAQLWEALPLEFDRSPRVMYYDSIDEVSYIAGQFETVNGSPCNMVKWDGLNYTLMPNSPLYDTYTLIRYNNRIFAGGSNGLAIWDGVGWRSLDTGSVDIIAANLYVYDNKLYVSGLLENIGTPNISYLGIWNDTSWSTEFYSIDTVPSFSPPAGAFNLINFKEKFYAAGNFGFYEDSLVTCEFIMLDSNRWRGVRGNGALTFCGNTSVNKMLVWKDTLFVCGAMSQIQGNPGNGVVKWDGQQWHKMSNGLLNVNDISAEVDYATVQDMLVVNNELYASGHFNNIDGIYDQRDPMGPHFRGLAKWTGERWCTMGTMTDNLIVGLGNFKDTLYAFGNIRTFNGDTIRNIARWIGGNYTDSCSVPGTTSIGSIANKVDGFTIFPNPAKGSFTISFVKEKIPNNAQVYVYDVTGRQLLTESLKSNNQQINTAHLKDGVYIAKIVLSDKSVTKKIVIR